MKIYRIAQFDQEAPDQATKKIVGRLSLYDQEDLEKIEALHLNLGEEIIPHTLIERSDSVEIWQIVPQGHPSAKQYLFSFMLDNKIIDEVTVNIM